MAVNLLEWRSLTALVNKQQSPEAFVADRIFGTTEDHLAEKIDLEIIAGDERLAEFINRGEAARQVNHRSTTVKTITLPEIALSKFYTPRDLFLHKDSIGGGVYIQSAGQLTEARNRKLARGSQDLRDRITRRREWMACQALQGKISVVQDNISFELDFGYVNGVHQVTLAGGAKWDQSTAKMIADCRKYKSQTMKLSGFPADTVILGTAAAEKFIENPAVIEALKANNYRVGTIDLTQKPSKAATFLGRILDMDFWEYSQQYNDTDGSPKDYIGSKAAIFVASQAPFKTHYGPITRNEGVTTDPWFARTFNKTNPDGTEMEVATSFVTAVHDPDAIVCVTTF